jgi:hypothetical protein
MEAAELARRVPGVTEVINNISLAPIGSGGDPLVRQRSGRTNAVSRY